MNGWSWMVWVWQVLCGFAFSRPGISSASSRPWTLSRSLSSSIAFGLDTSRYTCELRFSTIHWDMLWVWLPPSTHGKWRFIGIPYWNYNSRGKRWLLLGRGLSPRYSKNIRVLGDSSKDSMALWWFWVEGRSLPVSPEMDWDDDWDPVP